MSVDYGNLAVGDVFEQNGMNWKVVDTSLNDDILMVSASLETDDECFECFEFKIPQPDKD